jgi:Fe-S cluster assembly protein SufD
VSYLGINLLGDQVWQLGHQQATGERDSTTLLATVALGGDYARVRTDARLVGQGGTTKQVALYYADGDQMHDFRTLQDHVSPRTYSDLLFKGAVQDRAKSVYTGLIRIGEEARGSTAYQTNRNLTLSEGAWAESVPNLDIKTNDVKCSHASTVGPIDEEQRFYLESRGIPPEVAERLVVLGFFDDVLGMLPVGSLRADLRGRVAEKLQRRLAEAGAR